MAKIEDADLSTLSEAERKAAEDARARLGEGLVFVLEAGPVRAIARRPARDVYRKFRAERADPAKRANSVEALFLACLIYPTAKEFDRVLDEHPAIGDLFGSQLLESTDPGFEAATLKKA
jgi:hypothetical protein